MGVLLRRWVPDLMLASLLLLLWLLLLSGERWQLLGTSSPLALLWRLGTFGLVPLLALVVGAVSPYASRFAPLAAAASVASLPRTWNALQRLETAGLDPLEVVSEGSLALAWLFLCSVPLAVWALPALVRPPADVAGWYEDPSRFHAHRWFDGSFWTSTVSDAGRLGSCDWPDGSVCSHADGGRGQDGEVVGAVGADRSR